MTQEHKFWEESFKVYERGLALFKWPHVRDLWQTYLSQFVQRYKGTKLERARDLFRQAIDSVCDLWNCGSFMCGWRLSHVGLGSLMRA